MDQWVKILGRVLRNNAPIKASHFTASKASIEEGSWIFIWDWSCIECSFREFIWLRFNLLQWQKLRTRRWI
jgi:hypothetical protein